MTSQANLPDRPLPPAVAQETDDEIDLLKLWQTIWRRKWGIASLVLVVTLVTALVVLTLTPIYRASSSLLIEDKAAKVLSIEQIYGSEGTGSEYLQTQIELLRSRALAERVVRELNLTTHREFDPRQQPEPMIDVRGLFAALDIRKLLPVTLPEDVAEEEADPEAQLFDEVVDTFMERVAVYPAGKSLLVRISVSMADARMAARAANALADGFIESQLEAKMDMSMSASSWMNGRLGELQQKLKDSEDKLQRFREAENLVDVKGVTTISAAELSATGDRMIDARRARAEAESQYRQVQAMKGAGWEKVATVPAVLGNPLIQQFRTAEAKAQARVDEVSRRYGKRHPEMIAANTELAAAQAALKAQVEQVVAGIESSYQLAVANEGSLRSSFEAKKGQIQDISRKEFQLRELEREVEANRSLYDTFMTRLKETTATADLESVNARVVDRAVVPKEPVKPKKSLIVVVAAMLSLFVGVGLALLLDFLNNTFKAPEQVESKLNLPVFGILPKIAKLERKDLAHLFTSDKHKTFSESIRTIRTGMALASISHPHKVIVVTSSVPGEGKSTVSANIAYAFGQMEKVLLIDADLRRPTMARNFDFPVGAMGLANLIAGNATLEDVIREVDGIHMMCAGTVPPNPLEMLSSPRFAKLIEALRSKFDRIIIDSPPTQAVSDAIVLGTQADSLIYVIKSAATPIPLVERGIGQLLQSNAPVNGIVLNQVDVNKGKKYGYNYGGYYDYYGYSKANG